MEDNRLTIQPEESYEIIRNSVLTAQSKVYTVVNSAMVQVYWKIGQEIYLSKQLTNEFEKGFTVANLKNMRQFYRTFPIRQTPSGELSWAHYNLLMRLENNTYVPTNKPCGDLRTSNLEKSIVAGIFIKIKLLKILKYKKYKDWWCKKWNIY